MNETMPWGLEKIITEVKEGENEIRYSIVSTITEAIELIAKVSKSASDSMGYEFSHDPEDVLKNIARNIAEQAVCNMISNDLHIQNYSYQLRDSLIDSIIDEGQLIEELEYQTIYTTHGGVCYGWSKSFDFDGIFVYVGYPHIGTLTQNAEMCGMIDIPRTNKSRQYLIKKRFYGKSYRFWGLSEILNFFKIYSEESNLQELKEEIKGLKNKETFTFSPENEDFYITRTDRLIIDSWESEHKKIISARESLMKNGNKARVAGDP